MAGSYDENYQAATRHCMSKLVFSSMGTWLTWLQRRFWASRGSAQHVMILENLRHPAFVP